MGARSAFAEEERLTVDFVEAFGVCPEALILAIPVIDPGALAPLALVDRPLQSAHIADTTLFGHALVGLQPDAAPVRVDLAATVHANPAARSIAQLLRA